MLLTDICGFVWIFPFWTLPNFWTRQKFCNAWAHVWFVEKKSNATRIVLFVLAKILVTPNSFATNQIHDHCIPLPFCLVWFVWDMNQTSPYSRYNQLIREDQHTLMKKGRFHTEGTLSMTVALAATIRPRSGNNQICNCDSQEQREKKGNWKGVNRQGGTTKK